MPSIQNFIQDIDGRLGFLSVVVKMVQIEAILNEAKSSGIIITSNPTE